MCVVYLTSNELKVSPKLLLSVSTFSKTFKVVTKEKKKRYQEKNQTKPQLEQRHSFFSVNEITESCPNGCSRWSEATNIISLCHSDSVHIFFNVCSLSALTLFLASSPLVDPSRLCCSYKEESENMLSSKSDYLKLCTLPNQWRLPSRQLLKY